ncbi:putative E3 ubiquitin-protein ligase [Blattamonas nauphoetae]|uniref:E3 ubiquitin-protein ligase n=1 Tax=Blattamonas nauphoetae TaxID=2049346 RepID=A0ABQ9YBY0_9EUKA|nr:putative E3 ubiquitin-protein ligase [Blattamonas nauphoetae]
MMMNESDMIVRFPQYLCSHFRCVFIAAPFPGIDLDWVRKQIDKDPKKTDTTLIQEISEKEGAYPRQLKPTQAIDPIFQYLDNSTAISALYKQNCIDLVLNYCLQLNEKVIFDKILQPNHFHLIPSLQLLWTGVKRIPYRTTIGDEEFDNEDKNRTPPGLPSNLDRAFLKELRIAQMKRIEQIKEKQQAIKDAADLYHRQEANEEVCSCPLCWNDFLPERVIYCSNHHPICPSCMKDTLRERTQSGKFSLNCVEPGCSKQYKREEIIPLLGDNLANILFSRLDAAGTVETIGPNQFKCVLCETVGETIPKKTFYECTNPRCRRLYCLLCKQPYHPSRKCEAMVQDEVHTQLRRYVEDAMTESVAPHCKNPACGKAIMKANGCNAVKCTCGHYMCYHCGLYTGTVDSHIHIRQSNGTCPMWHGKDGAETPAIQNARIKQAAIRAEQEWRNQHPEHSKLKFHNPANDM